MAYEQKPSVDEILQWHQRLEQLYGQRNGEYSILRKAFDGDFVTNQQLNALTFGETTDERKLTYNMINSSTRRYMDEMSAPIQAFAVPRGLDDDDVDIAERRQKLLAEVLEENDFLIQQMMAAFNQSLLDKAVWLVRPDPTMKFKVRIELILPESYMPIPSDSNWFRHKGLIISWMPMKQTNWQVMDPNGVMQYYNITAPERVTEYWSKDWYSRLEQDAKGQVKETAAVNHKLGIVPSAVAHNIPVPHRHRGQGDSDQAVGMNEYLNTLISDEASVLAYLADPVVVVRGSKQGTGNLTWGPRAIWEMERDASVELLTWAGAPPTFEAQILRVMQGIEDMTGISSPAYGRDIPSGVSGETIRSILAGFNTRIGAKQSLMGIAINRVCVLVQQVLESQFPNEKFEVQGEGGVSGAGSFIQPKEFKGWYKVQTIFQPQNESVRTFTEIEKMKNAVQSRYTTMVRLGVPRPGDEYRRIVLEKRLDMIASAVQGGHMPVPAEGGMPPGAGTFGAPPTTDPRQNPKVSFPARDRSIQDLAEELKRSNPGDLESLLGVPGGSGLGKTDTTPLELPDLVELLKDADISGKAFAEGDIVGDGAAAGNFTIRVTNEEDIPQIKAALGRFGGRAQFVLDSVTPRRGAMSLIARPFTQRED